MADINKKDLTSMTPLAAGNESAASDGSTTGDSLQIETETGAEAVQETQEPGRDSSISGVTVDLGEMNSVSNPGLDPALTGATVALPDVGGTFAFTEAGGTVALPDVGVPLDMMSSPELERAESTLQRTSQTASQTASGTAATTARSQPAAEAPAGSSDSGTVSHALEKVKIYSEKVAVAKPSVHASFPFSLLITGPLSPDEKERLLTLISRENIGLSEMDLEPQFASERILVPRISEYAGVLIVQALRAAQAEIRFGPADSIFATEETRTTPEELEALSGQPRERSDSVVDPSHPAESILVTPNATLPNLPSFEVIDTLTASVSLRAKIIESENSPQYQETLDALKRELRYKAYRKGAVAIVNFSVQLTPLNMSSQYRVTVMGAAVRAQRLPELPI